MCNGANLAYKITFTTLNGFDGNDKIANWMMFFTAKNRWPLS
jgi:hypothetical protein